MTQKTLSELAALVGGRVEGDGSIKLHGVNGIDEAGPGEITFLTNPRYASKLANTRASAIVIGKNDAKATIAAIVADHPDLAFAKITVALVDHSPPAKIGIHPSAVIGERVSLGRDVSIGPLCVVEEGATIADGTVLTAQVTIGRGARIGRNGLLHPQCLVRENCILGDRVILQPGAIIGSDGFGYATVDGVHIKIPQCGIVVIGDDVEIGAGSTIDRARFGKTVIGKGTKIDNLVQVAHNVTIGEHCLFAAQVGIAGSTHFGNHVIVGGQAGFGGHLRIGDAVIVTGQSGVSKDLPDKAVVAGTYARPLGQHLRSLAALDRLHETLHNLGKRIEELEKQAATGQE